MKSYRVAITIGAAALLVGCSDHSSPQMTSPNETTGELAASFKIDMCVSVPSGTSEELDALCNESSDMTVSFDTVYPDELSAEQLGDITFRARIIATGPAKWGFSNDSVGSVLSRLDGASLVIRANRVVGPGYDTREVSVSAASRAGLESYVLRLLGANDFDVDSDGFPELGSALDLSGTFRVEYFGDQTYELAAGSGDVSIEHIRSVPVDKGENVPASK